VTDRHERLVRLQSVRLFSYDISFFKNGWSEEPAQLDLAHYAALRKRRGLETLFSSDEFNALRMRDESALLFDVARSFGIGLEGDIVEVELSNSLATFMIVVPMQKGAMRM